jgi:serine/threonine protein phosphatase PrpC
MADQFFGLTDTGKQRHNNEDAFIAEYSANELFVIACVIDGVGGYSGGEVAASIAREAILKRLDKPSGEIIPMMIDCFSQANAQILQQKQQVKENAQMACVATLAIIDIANNQFYYAHVGDTRLYLLRDESLVKISHDQSFVGFLEDSGRLTEEAAMGHPKRNEIHKALGFESEIEKKADYIETGQSPFLSGDLLLLCSDGLTDMVNKAEITEIITSGASLREKCRQLVDAANHHGGRDNITAVLVQNNKEQLQRSATRPAANHEKTVEVIPASSAGSPPKKPVTDRKQAINPPKKNRAPAVLVTLLILILLAANAWQYYQNKATPADALQPVAAEPVKKTKNPQEIKLQQAIDHAKGNTLILSDTGYHSPVIISGALLINRDSLLIKAKGKIELKSDSGYDGQAFNLSAKCKSIRVDSISFIDFKTAITCYNYAIQLKNVRFINCPLPLQNVFTFAAKKYIGGKLPYPIFSTDSLPPIKKK